jgi:hypothetical protein
LGQEKTKDGNKLSSCIIEQETIMKNNDVDTQMKESSIALPKGKQDSTMLFLAGVLFLVMGCLRTFISTESFMAFFAKVGHCVFLMKPAIYNSIGIMLAMAALWLTPSKVGKVFDIILILIGIVLF